MAGDKHPEWLPVDWKVEEKNRCGRKRKWYIAPKNGLKFFSKPQVLRYLNENVNTRQQRQVEQDKVTIERTVAENLPTGWIKEIRTRKVSGKQRKDTFYVEPDTEYEFRSMPSVLRYLEAKEGDEDHIGAEDDDHPQSSPIEAEEKILIENKGDEEFTDEKAVESEPSPPNSENPIQQNELQDIPVEDYLIEPCIDLSVESTKEEVQMDKSGETPAGNSSSELPPDAFFNVPWFSPAYKLIIDEIPVETYVQQISKRLNVPLQG